MAQPFEHWTVLPHGRLTQLEPNLMCVTGMLRMPPMGDVERRMTVARLHDGRLVIYSAIALAETEMTVLERFGEPAFLVVPNDIHRMDVKGWKERYPRLEVIAPARARSQVEELVNVDHTEIDFGDPSVRFLVVPGTDEREAALRVEAEGGTTLVLNDLIFDLANRPGLSGWLFKVIGMTGDEPHIPPIVKLREVKQPEVLRAQLERWSQLPNLRRVVISHGPIIEHDATEVLGRIAAKLAA